MGAYTWTFVRIDKLNKEQVKLCIENAIQKRMHTTYGEYSKLTEKEHIPKWLKMHKNNYDYFVNECDVPPEEMTEEYLTEELRQRIDVCDKKVEYYNKVLEGNMTFREMLENTKEGNPKHNAGCNHDFYIIKRQGDIYVNLKGEWWRNQRDSEDEFCTVDSLVEEVKKSHYLGYYDEDIKDWVQEDKLTPKLEKKLREFYGKIGDNNFYVHFG